MEGEVPLRLLPVLLGSAVAPLLFFSLRAQGLPTPLALLGGSLWAFLPQALLQDTEFRMYPLAALLVAAALLGAKRRSFPLWAGATALALWTHYLAGAVALSLGLPFGRRALLPPLAFLPWVPALLEQVGRVHQVAYWNEEPASRLKEVLALFWEVPDPLFLHLGALFWGLALLGLLQEARALLPLALTLGLLFAVGFQPVSPRYLPVLLPVLVQGAGVGASKVRKMSPLLLMALGLSWAVLLPWTALARLATSWPGLLP